jgi:hypothetical protein
MLSNSDAALGGTGDGLRANAFLPPTLGLWLLPGVSESKQEDFSALATVIIAGDPDPARFRL